jgi:hypothetical protein
VRSGIARRRPLLAVALLPLMLAGCKKSKDEPKDLGEQMRDVEVDTQVMRDAQAAVNEVIRAAGDCETAKPAIAAAMMKLDEVEPHVRTAAGNQTLGTLRKQVRQVQDMCP